MATKSCELNITRAVVQMSHESTAVRDTIEGAGTVKERAEQLIEAAESWYARDVRDVEIPKAERARDALANRDQYGVLKNSTAMRVISQVMHGYSAQMRLLNSKTTAARQVATHLFNTGLELMGRTRSSVEEAIQSHVMSSVQTYGDLFLKALVDYRKANPSKGIDDFHLEVMLHRTGDNANASEPVQRASKAMREKERVLGRQLQKTIDEDGRPLLDPKIDLTTDTGWIHRMWERSTLMEKEFEFKDMLVRDLITDLKSRHEASKAHHTEVIDDLNRQKASLSEDPNYRDHYSEIKAAQAEHADAHPEYADSQVVLADYNKQIADIAPFTRFGANMERAKAAQQIKEIKAAKNAYLDSLPDGSLGYARHIQKERALKDRMEAWQSRTRNEREIADLEQAVSDYSLDIQARSDVVDALKTRLDALTSSAKEPDMQATAQNLNSIFARLQEARKAGDEVAEAAARGDLREFAKSDDGKALAALRLERREINKRLDRFSTDEVSTRKALNDIASSIDKETDRFQARLQATVNRVATLQNRIESLQSKDATQRKKTVEKIHQEIANLERDTAKLVDDQIEQSARFDVYAEQTNGYPDKKYAAYQEKAHRSSQRLAEKAGDLMRLLEIDLRVYDVVPDHITKAVTDFNLASQRALDNANAYLLNRGTRVGKLEAKADTLKKERVSNDVAAATAKSELDVAKEKITKDNQKKISQIDHRIKEAALRYHDEWSAHIDNDGTFNTYAKTSVDDIYDKLTGKLDLNGGVSSTNVADLMPKLQGPLKDRTLNFINDGEYLKAGFLSSNTLGVLEHYVRKASADMHLTERFGSATLKEPVGQIREQYASLREQVAKAPSDEIAYKIADLTPGRIDQMKELVGINTKAPRDQIIDVLHQREKADVHDITVAVQKMRGLDPQAVGDIQRNIHNLIYSSRGGMFGLTNIGDLFKIATEQGYGNTLRELGNTFAGIQFKKGGLFGILPHADLTDEMKRGLNEIGVGADAALRNLVMQDLTTGDALGGTTKITSKLADTTGRLSGMALISRVSEATSYALIRSEVYNAILRGDVNVAEKMSMGPRFEQLKAEVAKHSTHGSEGIRWNFDEWSDQRLASDVRAYMRGEVTAIVTRRGVGDTPWWTTSPVGQFVTQFGGYSLSNAQKGMLRNIQSMSAGRLTGAVTVMMMTGMLIKAITMTVTGTWDRASSNPAWWIVEGFKNTPLFATVLYASSKTAGAIGLDIVADPIYKIGEFLTGKKTDVNLSGDKIKTRGFSMQSAIANTLGPTAGTLDKVARGVYDVASAATDSDKDVKSSHLRNATSGMPMITHPVAQALTKMLYPMITGED